MNTVSTRFSEQPIQYVLSRWCSGFFNKPVQLQPLAGDAGFRLYFRISDLNLLAVYAPPEHVDINQWRAVGDLLQSRGVMVPKLHYCDPKRGFLIIDDFGDRTLLQQLQKGSERQWYSRATEALIAIQQSPRRPATGDWRLAQYSRRMLLAEMELFTEWFIGHLLGLKLGVAERGMLQRLFEQLADEFELLSPTVVHRDYHSRNLMILPTGAIGVLDYQDACWGNPLYDVVSLLKDCYLRWDRRQVLEWLKNWHTMACKGQVVAQHVEFSTLRRNFDMTGLQRHLKVLGIFSRLWLRDSKPAYLNDLPRVYGYVKECVELCDELSDFGQWLAGRVDTVFSAQVWLQRVP